MNDRYDLEAAANARDRLRDSLPRDRCGTCGRRMYQEPPYPGVPSEWRHESTGQPLSWTPDKHLASRTHVASHSHRFEEQDGKRVCAVVGCEAEMLPRTNHRQREPESLSEKEAALAESRKRGAVRGQASRRAIPF